MHSDELFFSIALFKITLGLKIIRSSRLWGCSCRPDYLRQLDRFIIQANLS